MIKWCSKHPYQFSIYYFIFYLSFFELCEKLITSPVWVVHSALDDMIPFSPIGIIPYFLWFPWIAITVAGLLLWDTRRQYLRTCFTMYIGMTLILIFYCIVPNGLTLRPASIPGKDLLSTFVQWIYNHDSPENVCPSLHVYVSVCMDLAWTHSSLTDDKKWVRILLHILDISICIGVTLVKQHSIIDVLTGAALAVLIDLLVSKKFKTIPDTEFIA
jgi:membrane-associated phospholipid phosphatase